MASDENSQRKRLLYADLFKPKKEENTLISTSSCNSRSSHLSTWDSSSSSSTSEVEDGDSISELTRQMAEAMLAVDDDEAYEVKNESRIPKQVPTTHRDRRSKCHGGSGMRAVFLGSSRNISSGTGVFFPRVNNELQKKPDWSTVLIPTRVLDILELRFNNRAASDSSGPSWLGAASPTRLRAQGERSSRSREQASDGIEEMPLPQEWTY